LRFLPTDRSVCIAFGMVRARTTNQEVEMNDAKVLEGLEALRLPELQAKFQEVTGEARKSPNKKFLIRRIEEAQESIVALEKGEEMRAEDAGDAAEPAPKKNGRRKAEAADGDEAGPSDDGEPKISKLSVEELRAKHLELLGRETKSSNRTYLVWRVSQAAKGKIPTGPRARRANAGPHKVLPMRVPEAAVEPLKDVQKKLGIRSRNEMFNRAMAAFLINAGDRDLAKEFGATFSDDEE
jgi:hypothetical protein